MSDPTGSWELSIRTPVGRLQVALVVVAGDDGALGGSARSAAETVALEDVRVEGDRLTWSQSITRPLRLRLDFDVLLDGDTLVGHSRAGRLPRSAVSGVRATEGAGPP